MTRWPGCGREDAGCSARRCGRCTRRARIRGSSGCSSRSAGRCPGRACRSCGSGVQAFAASGKPTVAWAETFGEESGGLTSYVLATAFDEIWLQPGGGLGMLGVGVQTTFLRGALDKLGVEPQLEQRHEYKNAADQVLRSEFTPAHRESLERLTGSIFDRGGVSDRGRPPDGGKPGTRARRHRSADGRRGVRGAAGRPARLSRRGLCRVPVAGRLGRRTAVRRPLAAAPAAVVAGPEEGARRAGRGARRHHVGPEPPRAARRAGGQRLGLRRAAGRSRGRPGAFGGAADRLSRWLGRRLRHDLARSRPGPRGRQAGHRVHGRCRGVGRLLHRLPGRRDRRPAGHPDRLDRCVRRQVRGAGPAGTLSA